MPAPTRADRTSAFLRSFAIQGSWNYRTLLGGGLAYAMLPLLARVYAGNPVALRESLRRHAASFNGHPYLCTMAVGALARLESEGHDPARIERFRTALRGPLGALGDRAVWAGWRPVCLLGTILAFGLGLGPWKAAALFLVVYNAGHLWLRAWAFRRGWDAGLSVGTLLSGSLVDRAPRWLAPAAQLLLGAATGVLLLRLPAQEAGALGALSAAGVGAVGAAAVAAVAAAAIAAYFFPRQGGVIGVLLLGLAAAGWWL